MIGFTVEPNAITFTHQYRSGFFPHNRMCRRDSLSAQILSLFFLVDLLFGFGIGLDRVAMRADEFLSLFHNSIGSLEQFSRLLIQGVKSLSTSLTKIFPCFISPTGRA
jgi:hypothetical protein